MTARILLPRAEIPLSIETDTWSVTLAQRRLTANAVLGFVATLAIVLGGHARWVARLGGPAAPAAPGARVASLPARLVGASVGQVGGGMNGCGAKTKQ